MINTWLSSLYSDRPKFDDSFQRTVAVCLLAGDDQPLKGYQSKTNLVLSSLFLIFSILVPHSNGGFVIVETQPKPGGLKDTKEKKMPKRFDF